MGQIRRRTTRLKKSTLTPLNFNHAAYFSTVFGLALPALISGFDLSFITSPLHRLEPWSRAVAESIATAVPCVETPQIRGIAPDSKQFDPISPQQVAGTTAGGGVVIAETQRLSYGKICRLVVE
ncbi:MAG: hypothetical protein IPL29_04855 [Propionivibrio sp.]|nr:hypothetical protein [Propionivibrio sp.]